MESYKEKYEQALSVAKETYNQQPMYREWLEKMFPELKESEDEKVRKTLIRFFKDSYHNETEMYGVTVGKALAWLEKQGEQKPSDEEMKTLLRTEYEKGRADAIADMHWLKSLRPQNRWKPSDEQVDALTETVHNLWGSPETTLSGLLADLKKLKEG